MLPLPIAALRTASVALRNPANWNRAVPLSYEQFRYSFGCMQLGEALRIGNVRKNLGADTLEGKTDNHLQGQRRWLLLLES